MIDPSALEAQRKRAAAMTLEEVKEQMNRNGELIPELKECLSYSSKEPEKRFFVSTDNDFTRKARTLQAIRRWQSGAACGFIEKNGIKYFHPNLAADGLEANRNFLHREIYEYARQRVRNKKPYETINEERLFCNFLSSQPMAFNLFVPLMVITQCEEGQTRLARVISSLLDKGNRLSISRITEVGVEFIPDYYRECLNDKTAMDACFRYERADGGKGIIAIETKYTDILGKNQASDPTRGIQTATQRAGICELFTDEGKEKIASGEIKLSQVYRNFLLTECVRLHEQLDDSLSIVLAPKENKGNEEEEKQLTSILKSEYKYKFQSVQLEDFVKKLIREFPNEPIFPCFHHRYLDFSRAERLLPPKIKKL